MPGSARLAEKVVAAGGSVKGTFNRHVGLLEVCRVMAIAAGRAQRKCVRHGRYVFC